MRIHLSHIRFPWKIFSRVVVIQAISVLMIFFLAGLSARLFFKDYFLTHSGHCGPECHDDLNGALQAFDTGLALCLAVLGSLLMVFAVVFARRLIFPIGRMLVKAKSVLHGEVGEAAMIEALGQESYPEWLDLETSIEEIRRDLEAKIESLKMEREEQATLMSAISDAILAVDLEGAPLFYNTRFALLFGDRLSTHQRLWEILRNPEILEAFQQALRLSKSTSVKAIPFDHPTGKRFFSVSVAPLLKGKGAIYGAVGIFHDVTDLKRAEQIRIDFVANVSHELRTPLTAIKGYADTLSEDIRNHQPPSIEFLEIITRNTDRLMNLINDLLDLSSLESTDSIQKIAISTEEFTERVIKHMSSSITRKNQTIEAHYSAPTVLADPRRLEQVLINLLDNANKYSPSGSKICVFWETDQDKGTKATATLLKIRDTGPGIPLEHHPRLFERFYRVDKARSREQGGTGLGLAIVKHIMQGHDGTVSVESAAGKGTTFICRFPGV